jgi:ribonuclease HI
MNLEKRIDITIFTDGSCNVKDALKRGGFGVYCVTGEKEVHLRRGFWNTTVARMEMKAVLAAIQMIDPNVWTKVHIISDSQFVVNAFKDGFLSKWRMNGFLGVKNSELWKEIVREIEIRRKMLFGISWTRGHEKDLENFVKFGNACADELANYKTQDNFEQDSPLKGFSWFYHESSDAVFIEKTDKYEEMNEMGDILILGECLYANEKELLDVLSQTALLDAYRNGQLSVDFEIEKI